MQESTPKLLKRLIVAGIVLILISTLVLIFSGLHRDGQGNFFSDGGVFFINYALAFGYFFVVLFSNRPFYKFKQVDHRLYILSLVLFSISCFTLNHAFVLFATFTHWTLLYLLFYHLAFIGLVFINQLHAIARALVFFFLGAGLIMVLYFSVYLAPIYPFGIIGLLLLGISIHLFIPLLMGVSIVWNFIKTKKITSDKLSFYIGIALPLLLVGVFLFQWNNFKQDIHKASSSLITRPDNTLPEWVLLCQDVSADPFSNKIVKGDIVYDTFKDFWGGWSNNVFDEVKRHDPLVNVGLAIMGDVNLDRNQRIKILKSQFNARHLTQRKLWSGRDIGTVEVLSDVKVMPDYRLAYIEKIITIKNNAQWQSSEQEAAFTFYLPEGSVATSLSLWINGKEEKSRLTTKEKADSAYVSIVGVERRDPALMHWQEGNTLTVTIFPCTPKEHRKFKIGITTPLKLQNDKLVLSNVYFDGPIADNILETSRISFESMHDVKNVVLPKGYANALDNSYLYSGNYLPYWEVSLDAMPLSNQSFSFNGYWYCMKELQKQQKNIDLQAVYIDVNKSWTKDEFEHVLLAFKNKEVWVHHDKLIEVKSKNSDAVFERLSKKNFSLFPFNEIKDPAHCLVVSKSTVLSPNLADLEDSEFLNNLIHQVSSNAIRYNVFNIGNTLSPYLKSLKELQLFNYMHGELNDLDKLVANKLIAVANDDMNKVALDICNVSIERSTTEGNEGAPDHLLRVFAYNKIMKQMGRSYFDKDLEHLDSLTAIANEAYVVSPVSSLIVLESTKDYDRFDIPENENSLKNASMKSSGAVPEPSEWALIILFSTLLIVLYLRKSKSIRFKWL